MRTNQEIRQETSQMLKGNWSSVVITSLVFVLIASCTKCSFPLVLFVYCPLALGYVMTMISFVRGNREVAVENLFSAFNSTFYWKSMGLGLLTVIYTFLWSLLFIIPGIVKHCSYFLAPYILADNPSMKAEEAICRSMQLMEGHKMQLFLMLLGYALLVALSALLLFIPLFWIVPYYQVAFVKFYEEVRRLK